MYRYLLLFLLVVPANLFAQDDNGIILLARSYKDNMFRNEPTKEVIAKLRSEVPATMAASRDFIIQTISTKNDLLDDAWMKLPDETTLREIHMVDMLFNDMNEETRKGDQVVLDSVRRHPASRHELVRTYYSTLFTSVGNKNQPFNLSKLDLRPDSYGLKDDTERGIVFLECMDICQSVIWGYMNVVKPPNTSKAMAEIKKYPKVNGTKYYQFGDLNFPDFEFTYDDSLQSYKGVMVDQYLELLLYHLIVLDGEKAKEDVVRDLLLGSVMRDEKLWKYSKSKEVFESIFKKQK